SCGHVVHDGMSSDGGCAFALPAPRPKVLKPRAPTIVASATIFFRFIVQFLVLHRDSESLRQIREPRLCGSSSSRRTTQRPRLEAANYYLMLPTLVAQEAPAEGAKVLR